MKKITLDNNKNVVFKSLRLCRVREGTLTLGDLPVGKWRFLTGEERDALYKEGT